MKYLQPNTTLQGGKYRIERVLGQGGFGITYLAHNTVFDIDVAIKEFFMKDENERDGSSVTMPNSTKTELFVGQKEKFKKEAKRMFSIKNEHIIAVSDLFDENGTAYYVMDYVEGENLSERLKRTGKPLTEQEVCDILPQILDALKAVHDAGIWHLDLKPANIMLDKNVNVKLIDFGASKQLNNQKGGATTSTAISYTNGYAPREQMEQNYDKFGPWTDIYALGATLYNLLTNKRPPLPTDIDDDESEDKHEALPFPESVGGLKFLVLQMMKTNRMQRPQSIDAIIAAEQSRKEEPKQAPKPRATAFNSSAYDDEATIISESKPKKEEKTDDSKPQSVLKQKVDFQNTPPNSYNSSLDVNDEGKGHNWGLIVVFFVGLAILISIFVRKGYSGNSVEEPTTTVSSTPEKAVRYETAIGSCLYTGSLDENNKPHGRGEAKFDDGRYYSGGFNHGILEGDQCYFTYPNGDYFSGEFRNNYIYQGKYTTHIYGQYFVGYFLRNEPYSGIWYDRKGKVIDKLR